MGALVRLEVDETAPAPVGRRTAPEADRAHPADVDVLREARLAAASAAVTDWLETQARVVEYWRDLLAEAGVGADGDHIAELAAALDAHAAFLQAAARRA